MMKNIMLILWMLVQLAAAEAQTSSCMTNRFGLSSSPDLLNWKVEEAVSFPADARHGTVTQISAQQARALLNLKYAGATQN